jgi:hypothetical protein
MGLTIHWKLHSQARHPTLAREQVGQLRQRALDLPVASVGEIIEFTGDEADFDRCPDDSPHRWLLIQAGRYVERDGAHFRVEPEHVIAFETIPSDGCEAANFGLCRYPSHVTNKQQQRRSTGLTDWQWRSFCKTQYASDPRCGGVENFLKCHLSVVALLDYANSLGILDEVSDEGGYWKHRDMEALTREIGEWNQMIAAFAGQLKDALRPQIEIQSPISEFPNFEHLEARGQEQLRKRRAK